MAAPGQNKPSKYVRSADQHIDHMVEGRLVQPPRANHLLDDRLDDFSESLGGI
jgi:hypothetical protein